MATTVRGDETEGIVVRETFFIVERNPDDNRTVGAYIIIIAIANLKVDAQDDFRRVFFVRIGHEHEDKKVPSISGLGILFVALLDGRIYAFLTILVDVNILCPVAKKGCLIL